MVFSVALACLMLSAAGGGRARELVSSDAAPAPPCGLALLGTGRFSFRALELSTAQLQSEYPAHIPYTAQKVQHAALVAHKCDGGNPGNIRGRGSPTRHARHTRAETAGEWRI